MDRRLRRRGKEASYLHPAQISKTFSASLRYCSPRTRVEASSPLARFRRASSFSPNAHCCSLHAAYRQCLGFLSILMMRRGLEQRWWSGRSTSKSLSSGCSPSVAAPLRSLRTGSDETAVYSSLVVCARTLLERLAYAAEGMRATLALMQQWTMSSRVSTID